MNQHVLGELESWLSHQIIGQHDLVKKLLVALLADGHLLVEGAPGLAKTRAIKMMADGMEGDFHRVQFTPDLLPGDITGTDVFRPQLGTFEFQAGPIFHNLILADEINRAPAKVQSALLEAMAERQVSVGGTTYPLPDLFLVMATQNPIEQEGTYPLPEAQLDRFLMHVKVDYPNAEAERDILKLARREAGGNDQPKRPSVSADTIFKRATPSWISTWRNRWKSTSCNSSLRRDSPKPTARSSQPGLNTVPARGQPSAWIVALAHTPGLPAVIL